MKEDPFDALLKKAQDLAQNVDVIVVFEKESLLQPPM